MNPKYLAVFAEVAMESARENALEDEYLKLTDRPTVIRMMRVTEADEPRLCETVDYEDFKNWRTAKLAGIA